MTITLQEPYRTRPIRWLELYEVGDWRLKVYSIVYDALRLRSGLVVKAKELLTPHLPAVGENIYGVGFIGVHQGRGGDFVFIGWWGNENELFFHVYVVTHDQPDQWQYCNISGPLACTWDLDLIFHERQAWVDTVLANPDGPDIKAYLATRYNADV
jgi:hypothetical protein